MTSFGTKKRCKVVAFCRILPQDLKLQGRRKLGSMIPMKGSKGAPERSGMLRHPFDAGSDFKVSSST